MKVLLNIAAFAAALVSEAPSPQPFSECSPAMRELISQLEADSLEMGDVDLDAFTVEELDAAVNCAYKYIEAKRQTENLRMEFVNEKADAIAERRFC